MKTTLKYRVLRLFYSLILYFVIMYLFEDGLSLMIVWNLIPNAVLIWILLEVTISLMNTMNPYPGKYNQVKSKSTKR